MCCRPYRHAVIEVCATPGCIREAEVGGLCEHCYETVEDAGREAEAENEIKQAFNEDHPPLPRG